MKDKPNMLSRVLPVEEEHKGKRLDVYLAKVVERHSRRYLQSLVSDGYVTVDGNQKKVSYKVSPGELVEVFFPPIKSVDIEPADIPLNILHEDDDIIVVNKPAGLVTHPSYGHQNDTLVNALINYNTNLSTISGEARPGIVHRLDRDTSGVLVVAKNDQAHQNLSDQFKARTVKKEYRGYVRGKLRKKTGIVDAPIGRDRRNRKKFAIDQENGKEAVSKYSLIKDYNLISYVKVFIKTGRTHQIRVHMTSLKHPLVGDKLYGRKWNPKNGSIEMQSFLENLERVLLHAYNLTLTHPTSGDRLSLTAEIPDEFKTFEQILAAGI